MEQNEKLLSIYPLPALLTPLPLIPFTIEEITGWTNEATKGANKATRNSPSCFFILYFAVSVIHPNFLMVLWFEYHSYLHPK